MGLLRSLAKKVAGRVSGKDEAPRPAAPAAAKPAVAPAAKPPTPAPKPAASAKATVAARPGEPPVVEDAEALSTIECGAQELKERVGAGEPVVILDVREPFETQGGIIPGAKLIPLGQLPARWEEVKDANEVVVYCAHGMRSLSGAQLLRERGIFNATSMEGGFVKWMEIGGQVARPS